ncbi:MAG: rhodanese-like domain-containing protein [Alphaproteobacteria bacterium]|nr:rhodanese-like domain-containing protein [Alphaproteobacteria bacterium]
MTDYAGDVTVKQCWEALKSDPTALLVDVRTEAEWTFVGMPDLTSLNKQPARISWQVYPKMETNGNFVAEVARVAPGPDRPIYFLCRSGGRSRAAAIAMTKAGYARCYNVAGGFEGDLDGGRHRGVTGGWKAAGLPWVQS